MLRTCTKLAMNELAWLQLTNDRATAYRGFILTNGRVKYLKAGEIGV